MRVWYVLFAESPGFSPSREFSCFLPSPFVQLFCAQSGDPGGGECLWAILQQSGSIKSTWSHFPSSYTLCDDLFYCFLLTYRGYGEKPFSSPSVCQIASRGELELKKNLVCDPNLRIVLVIVWDLFPLCNLDYFQILYVETLEAFWGAKLVGLPHRLPYLKLVTSARAFSQVVYSWGKYWP